MYEQVLDDAVSPMTYYVFVEDLHGNSIYVLGWQSPVSISDNDPPDITNLLASPSLQYQDGFVNLTATIIDNINVDSVFVNVTYPNATSMNVSITSFSIGHTFYFNSSYLHPCIGWQLK